MARLKLHHFEKHSTNEYATMFTNRDQSDDGHKEGESVNADSSQQDDSRQSSGSNSDTSVDGSVAEASRLAARESGRAVRGCTSRKSQVACPNCSYTCSTALLLRLHHVAVHDGIAYVDPPVTERRLAVDEHERGWRGSPASPQTRPRKMYGYRRDDFVCSDTSSTVSYDEDDGSFPDEASSDATVVSLQTSDDETGVLSGTEEAAGCDRCDEQFPTKLDLAAHLRRVHRVRVFCSYCGHGSRKAQLLRVHHRRNHQRQPFKYLTLNDGKLVNVTQVDSDDECEEETADEGTCLLGKPAEVPKTHPRKVSRKKPAKATQQSHRKRPSRRRHAASQNSMRISSSSSEEDETAGSSMQVVPSILRNVYFGYRCPKSVSAFQTLMANASDMFKCSALPCGFSTNISSDFVRHLARHRLDDVFCMYCGTNVPHPAALVAHLEQEHSGLQHQCLKCLYRAGQTAHFRVHFMQAHPDETVAFVPVAGERRVAALAPPTEKKVSRPYECGFTGCSFKELNHQVFVRHFEEVHAGASLFPCSVCDRSFRSVTTLLEHLQEHGLADLECCYCSFGAASTSAMMFHACYSHASHPASFAVRNNNLSEKLMTSSSTGALYVISGDVTPQLVCEQRCSFCPCMVAGFRGLQKHTRTAHGLFLSPEELADRLFGMYDYTEALQLGRCPFCPYAGDRVTDLQQHVLRQELQISNFVCSTCEHGFEDQLSWQNHIDGGQCPTTAMLQLCNNGPLVQWVHQNLPFKIQKFECTMCPQFFRATSTYRSHLLRHYTYYPLKCKLCGATCRGTRGREAHLRTSHGTGGEDETDGGVEAEVARQTALCTLPPAHTCPHCGFRTVNPTYHAAHVTRCAVSPQHPQVAGDGSNSEEEEEEEEDKPIYHCMHCSVSFIYLERLLSHGYVQHGCSWFCTVCYQGYETELGCLQHCKDPGCNRPGTMFLVERAKKKTPGREFFYSEVTVDECAADLSGLSLGEQEIKAGFTYYLKDIEPIHRIAHTYVSAGKMGKISLPDFASVVNIQPYVRVRDWKKSF